MSAGHSCFYVKVAQGNQPERSFDEVCGHLRTLQPRFRGRFEVRLTPSSSWVAVKCSWGWLRPAPPRGPGFRDEGLPWELIRTLSSKMSTKVLGLLASQPWPFEFGECEAGKQTRIIKYRLGTAYHPPCWVEVEGESLPCEVAALFSKDSEALQLQKAEDAEQRDRIKKVYEVKQLEQGDEFPIPVATAAVVSIAEANGLPVVQSDSKSARRKVFRFLPFFS